MVELKLPEPLLLKATVPVAVTAVPADVSVTVAVHVEDALTASGLGEQTTLKEEDRFEAVRLKVPELPRWFVPPP